MLLAEVAIYHFKDSNNILVEGLNTQVLYLCVTVLEEAGDIKSTWPFAMIHCKFLPVYLHFIKPPIVKFD